MLQCGINIPLYFRIYISYQHVHVLHIIDSPSPSGFLLVAGNFHDNGVSTSRYCGQRSVVVNQQSRQDYCVLGVWSEGQVKGAYEVSHNTRLNTPQGHRDTQNNIVCKRSTYTTMEQEKITSINNKCKITTSLLQDFHALI